MTPTSTTAATASLAVVAFALLVGCAGNRAEPEGPIPGERQDHVRVCVDNTTDYQITARIFGGNGAPLLRMDTRIGGSSADSIRSGEAQGKLYVAVDAVGIPDTHFPPAIQNVAPTGSRVGFTIAGQGRDGFPTSSVDPEPCG